VSKRVKQFCLVDGGGFILTTLFRGAKESSTPQCTLLVVSYAQLVTPKVGVSVQNQGVVMNIHKENIHKVGVLLGALALILLIAASVNAQTAETSTAVSPTNFWRAAYFNNLDLTNTPALLRPDPTIDFDWGNGAPVAGVIGADNFSVRWTRTVALTPGAYEFTIVANGDVRLWLNNQLLINQAATTRPLTTTIDIPSDLAGSAIPVQMEYVHRSGPAIARLNWTAANTATSSTTTGGVATATITGAATLNVRSGPGTEFETIATLADGQVVRLDGRSTNAEWLQVRLPDNRLGWVSTLFVTPSVAVSNLPLISAAVTTATPEVAAVSGTGGAATATVTGAGALNVRSGPGTDFSLLSTLPDGQSVTLAGRNTDATWLQVSLPNGQLGWVSAQFLTSAVALTNVPVVETAVAVESIAPALNTGGATLGVVAVTGTLNVRFGPGIAFTSFAALTNGENVTLEGRSADGAWIQIRLADGRLGWVSSQYLSSNVPFANLPVSTSANQ
jgi:uncharacterized protein YraI